MKIKVQMLGTLYMITKKFQIEIIDNRDMKLIDLINYLINLYPKLKEQIIVNEKLSENISILVNGREYRYLEGGLNLVLKDGDIVSIVPPAGGG